MKKGPLLVIGLILLLLAIGLFGSLRVYAPTNTAVTQATNTPQQLPSAIEIADTAEARQQGLSGRAELPPDYGMLFIFDEDGAYGFWMKDMLLSIDMIWIRSDGTIAHIESEVSPNTYPSILKPSEPVRYVLETRAGYARERGWKEGTQLDLAAYGI